MSKKKQLEDTETTVRDNEQQAQPEGESTPTVSAQASESTQEDQAAQETQDVATDEQDAAAIEEQTTITKTEKGIEQPPSENGNDTPRRSILEQAGIPKLTNKLGNMFTSLIGKSTLQDEKEPLQGEKKSPLEEKKSTSQRLKDWASTSLAERQDLYANIPESIGPCTEWLQSLPAKELKQFVHKLEHFCTELGFELAWLLDPKITTPQSMKLAMERIVLQFCLIHWQNTQAHETFVAFSRHLVWKEDPMSKDHHELTRKLFPRLVEKGLVSEPPADLFLFSEEKRRDYVVDAIQEASQKDIDSLLETLSELNSSSDLKKKENTASMFFRGLTEGQKGSSGNDE